MSKVSVKSMSPDERREYMRELGRRGGLKGGKTRAKQFTSASQRAARRKVSRESCRSNGRKGAERTIELHGYKALFEGSRRKRLANPSRWDLVMMGLLKTLDLFFVREHQLAETLFTLDFYLPKFRLGIEVDGSIHDAGKPEQAKRVQWAEQKEALCRAMQIKLIRVHHTELAGDDLSPVINKIQGIAGDAFAGNRGQHRTGTTGEPPTNGAAGRVGRPDF